MPLNKSQQVQNVATLHNILLFEPENVLRGCKLLASMAAVVQNERKNYFIHTRFSLKFIGNLSNQDGNSVENVD